ncbi:RecQ family ATP-dependent DNA helicase [Vibrio sp. WXL103]|uniref:RecQ family ATP-dependent DNA helicase n=1 Tax=Vibrio sp. WXL103 TaxID=3450710 RepID=UPI003EC5D1F5
MQKYSVLSLDLEITKDGKYCQHIGAVLERNGEEIETLDIKRDDALMLEKLLPLAHKADVLLGHNILDHDLSWLKHRFGDKIKALADLPVIDTLYLSPLAFPKNPYHRLIKDYKIVKDSYNNPVEDARLTLAVFKDQTSEFIEQYKASPSLIETYHELFKMDDNMRGVCLLFESIFAREVPKAQQDIKSGLAAPMSSNNLSITIGELCSDKCCPNQYQSLMSMSASNIAFAYVLAWLQVSGGNSVLPPWVWRRFPQVKVILDQLRNRHCGDESCPWCAENHSPERWLERYFGFDSFRPLPDNRPLQRQIVKAGMEGESSLGILPTGGGKSLCYQLPALVRNCRNGSLTIVISPLQSLMKDQVDGLKNKVGLENVDAVYGMLTMPERAYALERIRMGDTAILYLSPEQLRNRNVKKALETRQIGAWVFDEAHCLSKWGHDFRPDYQYCAKVIKRIADEQNTAPAPVFCFTATAKLDVIEDICDHFNHHLDIELTEFDGGADRTNLQYEVIETPGHSKLEHILNLLEQYFADGQKGCCVIFCATRKHTQELSDLLEQHQELTVEAFHAGLDTVDKVSILERFLASKTRVIVATNAFGMGIDKEDVRLVIHYEIPGSLENYLQEAGRAGRDTQAANCVLLFDQQDIEQQFHMLKMSEVRHRDISAILKELRGRARVTNGTVVATSRELLGSETNSIELDDKMADTKVKTAIASLERANLLSREDNVTSVFQGKPKYSSVEQAVETIEKLGLSYPAAQRWEHIAHALINTDADKGLSADDLMVELSQLYKERKIASDITPDVVMKTLSQMADVGLVSKGFLLTAFVCPKGRNNSLRAFELACRLELMVLSHIQELAPDASDDGVQIVDLRQLNTWAEKHNQKSSTHLLRRIFSEWAEDGKISQKNGSVSFKTISQDTLRVQVNRPWSLIKQIIERRQLYTQRVIEALYLRLPPEQASAQKFILCEFSIEELMPQLKEDLEITSSVADKTPVRQREILVDGIQRALLFLNALGAIRLQNGMAVFKQAMEIKVSLENTDRYLKRDYKDLSHHYAQKIIQVHVMLEYANVALRKLSQAQELVKDYFSKESESFIGQYFKSRKKILELACSQEAWKQIVTSLNNKAQENIVTAKIDSNQLVLAGPGSGKTKVIVHRIAYLMRVEQVPADKILVLCYNHNAAVSLHQRLIGLIGKPARVIRVHTFHGLAMRLAGISIEPDKVDNLNFDDLITNATSLLEGKEVTLGVEEHAQRTAILGGLEHVLVDEYQDIDDKQYKMLLALTGKHLEEENDKLAIMAVGDDDQSIYGFRGANIACIRSFERDYLATRHYLTANYRSTKHVIESSNALISLNSDRMKVERDICIDERRKGQAAGGALSVLDNCYRGEVVNVICANAEQQANEVVRFINHFANVDPEFDYRQVAVLARHGMQRPVLIKVRSVFAKHNIACCYALEGKDGISLYRVREVVEFLRKLEVSVRERLSPDNIRQWLPATELRNNWHWYLDECIDSWESRFGSGLIEVPRYLQLFKEQLSENQRQTRFGDGVLLSTVHGVKGEEFKYVFVLDGDWQASRDIGTSEDERRLYYVAMTRAEKQLVLFQRQDCDNPHIIAVQSRTEEKVLHKEYSNQSKYLEKLTLFSVSGLQSLVLSYPCWQAENALIHERLRRLNVGDQVNLKLEANGVFITSDGIKVAKLSQKATEHFSNLSRQHYTATVIAMIERHHDPENEYERGAKVETWWVPVVQVESNIVQSINA